MYICDYDSHPLGEKPEGAFLMRFGKILFPVQCAYGKKHNVQGIFLLKSVTKM